MSVPAYYWVGILVLLCGCQGKNGGSILSHDNLAAVGDAFRPGRPPLPRAVPAYSNRWYFAATAVSTDGLESTNSNEVTYGSTNRNVGITLAWDRSVSTNVAGYKVYVGGKPGTYTNWYSAGLGLSLALQLVGTAPKTNRLGTVTLQRAGKATGPYTNVPGMVYYLTNQPDTYLRLMVTNTLY